MIPVLASSLMVFAGVAVYLAILDARLRKIISKKNE